MPLRRPTSKLSKRVIALTKPLQRLALFAVEKNIRVIANTVFSSDEYLQLNPDLADSGFIPVVDYLLFGGAEGRDPHPLFDTRYYLDHNQDVSQSKQNPLLHYVRFGAREGRNPHRLFNTRFYTDRYEDVQRSLNPLLHYIEVGEAEYRQASKFFDPEFYRGTQIDNCRHQRGALLPFVKVGVQKDHPPSVNFDPAAYRIEHPDVVHAGLEPFNHYIEFGHSEGRRVRAPRFESSATDQYLPVRLEALSESSALAASRQKTSQKIIDIVIPVYRGFGETKACLESVFEARNRSTVNIIVINDATPDPELEGYLLGLVKNAQIQLIEHKSNFGFVASVNEGISVHADRDVILLNSDAEVFGDWVDRLRAHAYSGRVASVTPFSNNATICSYPKFCENNILPKGVEPVDLDRAFAAANSGRHAAIPTGVGFCMYIRRDALNEVGLFDQATFGRGYGEENDFCMRALDRGWWNLLAADTFVYHAGGISFGPSTEPQKHAMEALLAKHPRYMDHVGWHVQINPANAFRIAATVHRLRNGSLPVRLNVVHNLGGGTVEHIKKLENMTRDQMIWLHVEPAQFPEVRLFCDRPGFEFSAVLDSVHELQLLSDLVRYVNTERVHVHHFIGFPLDMRKWVEDSKIPYDVTLHDYYFVCPRVNFKDSNGRYCGESQCRCKDLAFTASGQLDLLSWRAAHGDFLTRAERVIAPSADTASRMQRYFPWLNITPAWHEFREGPIKAPVLNANEPLRIAVLGAMSKHKGFDNLRDCVRLAARNKSLVEFILIGGFGNEMAEFQHEISSTNWYQPEELPGLLARHAPHLIWFPCQWPETFSYTLSTCLELGLPVAVPDLGAFAERLNNREWSWILPWDTTPLNWLLFFDRVRVENFLPRLSPPAPVNASTAERNFYPEKFLKAERTSGTSITRFNANATTVLAIPSTFSSRQVQACGYVRIVQPLTHPSVAGDLKLSVVDVQSALRLRADALIVQRTAVINMDDARKLVEHCHRFGIRLIYEIDDDLFRLPVEHPEYAKYQVITKAAKLIARAADAVTVSTAALQQVLLRYNENVILIPNFIDERLWLPSAGNQRSLRSRPIRALYMGTSSHAPDLAMLEEAVRGVTAKFDFTLDVIGVTEDAGPAPWFRCIPVPDQKGVSYPNFVNWLVTHDQHWDFGLAPLVQTCFNAHKSTIKVYEYAAMGLPTIASAVTPYAEIVDDSKTGLLVQNTAIDWQEALSLLCESNRLRHRLQAEVLRQRHSWTLASNAESLRSGWQSALLSKPLAKAISASAF